MIALSILFTFLILYTYLFYPLSLVAISARKRRKKIEEAGIRSYPTVSMVIPAYNEERFMEGKLKNCLGLDYPNDLIEFVVGSDGSTDRTNDIVRQYSLLDRRIKLFEFDKRRGKASVLNKVVPIMKSEIIVFSDADTIYEKDSIKNLVRHFSNPKVGGVCGKLIIMEKTKLSCGEESVYWNYENMIKELESEIRTITGINGQIFVIRRELFQALPEDSITEDQVLGMKIIGKGYNILFEPDALCKEKGGSLKGEFLRRVRISAGNFQSIALSKKILDPRMGFASFALWSHKILRWFAPFFFIAIFVINLFLLDIPFFKITFFCQILFYLNSILYYGLNRMGFNNQIMRTIFYFNIMNLAILIGFIKFLTKTQKVTWEKTR